MTQGERVKEVRKSLRLTLEKFGEKLGVTKVAISNIEKGNRALTEQMAKAICREYNVNYDWLTAEDGDMFSSLPQTVLDELCLKHNLDNFDRVLIEMYLGLSEEERDLVKEKIHEIIGKLGYVKPDAAEPHGEPIPDNVPLDDDAIDREVEAYREELNLQKSLAERSSASDTPGVGKRA